MPEYIPARKGFPEQWLFDQSDTTDTGAVNLDKGTFPLFLAVSTGGAIDASLVRFLIHFERGPQMPVAQQISGGPAKGTSGYYRTAWVPLQQLRDDLGVPRPRPLARLAEKYLGWPARSLGEIHSITLANG